MTDEIIRTDKIGCKIGNKHLIQDISWSVKRGEHWLVFGMNGSGKTTLLSIIAGYKHYTDGSLELFGNPLTEENILDIRKKIGWVSASFFDKYYTKESVTDIVLSGVYGTLGLNGIVSLKDRKLARKILMELGLASKVDYTFDMLSKGERQNVLIARALISKPEILVLDEPCTGLDIYNRAYLFKTLELLGNTDLAIIYVTHYMEEIMSMFDKAILLKNGKIFTLGDTKTVFLSKSMDDFFGHPVAIGKTEHDQYRVEIKGVCPNIHALINREQVEDII